MNFIQECTIDNAWRAAMALCVKEGKDFVVKGGSYIGQIRKQMEFITIVITEPGTRPLSPILPPGIPGPTNEQKIEEYFQHYLFSNERSKNESYTYGEFIMGQFHQVVKLLNESNGNTNQATIAIGDTQTTFSCDPPCLRHISFKLVDGRLNMCVYFRSWDLYAGLPENLGGLQLLKEAVLAYTGDKFEDGKIIAFSDGLHLYEQYFDLVDCLNIQKVGVDEAAVRDKNNFIKTL